MEPTAEPEKLFGVLVISLLYSVLLLAVVLVVLVAVVVLSVVAVVVVDGGSETETAAETVGVGRDEEAEELVEGRGG